MASRLTEAMHWAFIYSEAQQARLSPKAFSLAIGLAVQSLFAGIPVKYDPGIAEKADFSETFTVDLIRWT
jgi:hypothetical protein